MEQPSSQGADTFGGNQWRYLRDCAHPRLAATRSAAQGSALEWNETSTRSPALRSGSRLNELQALRLCHEPLDQLFIAGRFLVDLRPLAVKRLECFLGD